MLKVRKKPFFFTLFIFFITLLVVIPVFFSSLSGLFLKSYSKKILGQEIICDSLKFENGKILAKNIKSSSEYFDLDIEEIYFKIKLNIFSFSIDSDLLVINPCIVFKNKKNIDFSEGTFWKEKRKIIKSKINVKNGVIKLFDKNQLLEKIFFSLEQKDFNDVFRLKLGFEEKGNEKIFLEVKKEDKAILANLNFDQISSSHLLEVISYFSITPFEKLSGDMNGKISISLLKTTPHFLFDLSFSDFSCKENYSSKLLGAKKIKLVGSTFLKKSKSILAKKLGQNFKLKAQIENGYVFLEEKKPLLDEINGSFYYNPGLGPNVNLKAKVNIESERKDCLFESRGYFNSKFCNWMDFSFSFLSGEKDSGLFLKFLEKEKDSLLVDVKLEGLKNECFYLFKNILPKSFFDKYNVCNGQIDLDGGALIVKDKLQKVFIERVDAKEMNLRVGEVDVSIDNVSGSLDFDLNDFSSSISSNLSISNANVKFKRNGNEERVEKIKANILLNKGSFQPSLLGFEYLDLKTNVNVDGSLSECVSSIEVKGCTKKLLKHSYEDKMLSLFSFKRKKDGGYFSGIVQVLGSENNQENLVFGINLKNLTSLDFTNWISSGWVRGERVILDKWQELFSLKDVQLKGKTNFSAFFQNDAVNAQIQIKDFIYRTSKFEIAIDKIGEEEDLFFEKKNFVNFTYNLKSKEIKADIPPLDGRYYMADKKVNFDCKNVKINLAHGIVDLEIPTAKSDNLNFEGRITLDYLDHPKLDILTKSISGSMSDLSVFTDHFGLKLPPLKGSFESYENGFYFSTEFKNNEMPNWGFKAKFKDLGYQIFENISISNAQMVVEWDVNEDRLNLSQVDGTLNIGEKSYALICPQFLKSNNKLVYDIRIAKPTLDLFRAKGEAHFEKEQINFNFDPSCHFLGEKINVSKLILDKNFQVSDLTVETNLDLNKMSVCLDLQDFFWKKSRGIINAKILFTKDQMSFDAQSSDLTLFDKKINKFFIKGQKDKEKFVIESIGLNELIGSFTLEKKADEFLVDSLKICHKNSFIEGEAHLKNKKLDINIKNLKVDLESSKEAILEFYSHDFLKSKLSLQGKGWVSLNLKNSQIETDLDLTSLKFEHMNVWVENHGELHCNYSSLKGVKISGLDLIFSCKDIDLSAVKSQFKYLELDLNAKKWIFKGGYFFIPVGLLSSLENKSSGSLKQILFFTQNWLKIEKDLGIEVEIEYENESSVLKMFSKEASIFINGAKRELKDVVLKINNNISTLDFKYLHENSFHQLSHIFDFASFEGKLICGTEIDPLTIAWQCDENGIVINKISGEYNGISIDGYLSNNKEKQTYDLFGSLKIDFSKALNLFPVDVQKKITQLKLAKGYEAQGSMSLLKSQPKMTYFEGKILGKDFQVNDYSLKTFFGDIKAWPDLIEISGFKISDLSGVFFASKITIGKLENSWFFSIPKIEAFEIRPSLMKKIGADSSEIKPLTIRNFELTNFKGNLSDATTITGSGFFSFVNSFKREHSVLEIPSEMLGRLVGLDTELLVPVCGDVFFDIKDCKCLITKINDVYSENKRSKFFLIDKPYMDFDGNLNIEIKMKQYVLFKITDKFIISIKGNLQKPEMSLKKKKAFLSD